MRAETHRRDVEGTREGAPELVAELEASARDYAWAEERFEAIGRDLLGALAPYAEWTSAATHAVLPLLATDAGVELQAQPASRRIAAGSANGAAASGCPNARTPSGWALASWSSGSRRSASS